MKKLRFSLLIFIIAFTQQIFAESLNLVINGKAFHQGNGDYNEDNWGLGFEYNFKEDEKWINFVNGGFFKDSTSNTSKYFGGGTKRRFLLTDDKNGWHIDAGVTAFLMTRKDVNNEQPFFGGLPFMSIGTSKFAINGNKVNYFLMFSIFLTPSK